MKRLFAKFLLAKSLPSCLLLGALLVAQPCFAFSLDDVLGSSDKQKSSSTGQQTATGSSATTGSPMVDGLVGMVSEQLGVSSSQAIGGLGALVGYASNNLPEQYATQLQQLLPGLADNNQSGSNLASGLLKNFSSMDAVKSTFKTLGMDASMVDQFTPLLESYLSDNAEGASGLVNALQSLW